MAMQLLPLSPGQGGLESQDWLNLSHVSQILTMTSLEG